MIVAATCPCGRSFDAASFALLLPTARFVEDGQERQRIRCLCGRSLEVTVLEWDACREIESARREARSAYSRARFELAMMRAARVSSLPVRWDSFRLVRAEARAALNRAVFVEGVLAGVYRAREIRSPKKRLGRNLVVVDPIDVHADTERPRAAR